MGESLFQLFVVLVIFIGVLALTYYVTKWLAGYQKAQQVNRNLEVVETLRLTTNKYVQIIRAGEDSYYVIAHGKDEITFLGTLSKDSLIEEIHNENAQDFLDIDFKNILEKISKGKN